MNKNDYFGFKNYLVEKFDDITTAVKCAKNSLEFAAIDELVKGISTKKNNAYTYEVFRTKGKFDGRPVKYVVGHVVIGLNGPGKQEDYLSALAKLVKSGVAILDAHLDVCDDLWDFLVIAKDEECAKKEAK